ncbi:unnamed protein product [Dracunculus medinensis]|uniref:Proline dehydrogenase n=1 Tax=Dracunculus medinensis TaxID=318479 RepID=A0A0N4U568_DRAME|nr:unnamed protein product [Dracunculus medinensis]
MVLPSSLVVRSLVWHATISKSPLDCRVLPLATFKQSKFSSSISSSSPLSSQLLSPSPSASPSPAENEIEKCYRKLDLSFENTREAYKSKTNFEIIRSLFVLRLISNEFLVRYNDKIFLMMRKIFGKKLFNKILKLTAFGQFVAGETMNEVHSFILPYKLSFFIFRVTPILARMRTFGVKAILDYSVEADLKQTDVENVENVTRINSQTESVANVVGNKIVEQTRLRYSVDKDFADRRKDVFSARTYFYEGEGECDKNCDIFCETIDKVAGEHGFIAVKLTALGRPQILLKLSETIVQTKEFFRAITGSTWENLVLCRISANDLLKKLKDYGIKTNDAMLEEWLKKADFVRGEFVDFYNWGKLLDQPKMLRQIFQVFNIKSHKMEPLLSNLSDTEENEFENMVERIVRLAEYARRKGIRITIDAEQTYFQPAIAKITLAMMRKYNTKEGHIFQTYQTYLKNCLNDVELDMDIARRDKFHFGCKLVRGAYMEQERKRAQALGYDDPINSDAEATSQMYEKVLRRIIQEHEARGRGWVSVMVASHNENSIRGAVQLMKTKNIAPSQRISFPLGQAGYSIYKYVPYGPVEGVLPYLSRRAQENTAVTQNTKKQRELLWKELKRRMKNGEFIYKEPNLLNP